MKKVRKIFTLREERKLEGGIVKLKKYCHHKGCKNWEGCPRDHVECEGGLGLDTAIAWTIATDIIPDTLDCILSLEGDIQYDGEYHYGDLITVQDCKEQIVGFIWALNLDEGYRKLSCILESIYRILRNIAYKTRLNSKKAGE